MLLLYEKIHSEVFKMKLTKEFYNRDSLIVAEKLLGKILVSEVNGEVLAGKIVETEAYRGAEDKAAHSYNNRRTLRTEVMFGEAARAYIYFIYGMYNCMNIVCEEVGTPQAVLIRALEPVEGIELMCKNRYKKFYEELTNREKVNLSNGPGKLCKALNIDRTLNGENLLGDKLYLVEGEKINKKDIVLAKRVGIDYAEEAKDFLWRFYIKDNKYVSKK